MKKSVSEKSLRHGRIFRYVPLILWIGLILLASTTNASMSNTSRFVRPILEFLFPNASDATLLLYHGYVRKTAHFAEYAILAFFASRAFWNSAKDFLRKFWYVAALVLVLMIGSIDELNQSLNPTRTGSVFDVLIDLSGGIFMVLMLVSFRHFKRKKFAG